MKLILIAIGFLAGVEQSVVRASPTDTLASGFTNIAYIADRQPGIAVASCWAARLGDRAGA